MGIKKVISCEVCLNDNDWNEIGKALPKLAKRQILSGYNLTKTVSDILCDGSFLDLLEKHFELSLAKDLREYLENNEECCLEDVPGFADAIASIDNKVNDYIKSNNIQLKASYFESEKELKRWYESFDSYDIVSILWDVIRNNLDNPLVDKIVSELKSIADFYQ